MKKLKADYADKLLDPRWIKKREKIIKRDGYRCTVCGAEKDLIVHHTFYYSTYPAPWEYPDNSLLTTCRECHYEYHYHHEVEIRELPKKRKGKAKRLKKAKKKKMISLAEFQMIRGIRIRERNHR